MLTSDFTLDSRKFDLLTICKCYSNLSYIGVQKVSRLWRDLGQLLVRKGV